MYMLCKNKQKESKFAVFGICNYYPDGGMDDLLGFANNIQTAEDSCKGHDWYQVVNCETWEIVYKGKGGDLING